MTTHIHVLLAVWGEDFIEDCFKFCLPSLLAPGNIPALLKDYPTRFVFLTRSEDISYIENTPAFIQLKKIVEVDFIDIDDLIVFGNHSATLTLAYDRAIRQCGEEMLNTYFIILTADFIMADKSFQGLMRYIQHGYSGICAGNFQVLKSEMAVCLEKFLDSKGILQIGARDLLKKSLSCLHPIVYASLFEQGLCHNYYANRFFVKLNSDVMAGKFYLLHPLCIKPERIDYKIGASCDYSFIPEMCPTGNVAVINDSDDYFVVEMQSKKHESYYIQDGSFNINKLAECLAEWTTINHRSNPKTTIYYHAKDLTSEDKDSIEKIFRPFIQQLTSKLQTKKNQPYSNHPYWIGSMQGFHENKLILSNKKESQYLDFVTISENRKLIRGNILGKLSHIFCGVPPNIFPWHYRWHEHQSIRTFLQQIVNHQPSSHIVVLYDHYEPFFIEYFLYFYEQFGAIHQHHLKQLMKDDKTLNQLKGKTIKHCIFLTAEEDIKKLRHSLKLIINSFNKNTCFTVLMKNPKDGDFHLSEYMNVIDDMNYCVQKIHTIHNPLVPFVSAISKKIKLQFSHDRAMRYLCYLFLSIPGVVVSLMYNAFQAIFNRKWGCCTHVIAMLNAGELSDH